MKEKKVIFFIFISVFFYILFGSSWNYNSDFVCDVKLPHGIVITPNGKIWVGSHGLSDTIQMPNGSDSLCTPIFIFNSDGTLFKKIITLSIDSKTDTLFKRCRGLSLDQDGNVLYTAWDELWKIDYQTYQAMNKLVIEEGLFLGEATCDSMGNIFIAPVISNQSYGIFIYNQGFESIGYIADTDTFISRNLLISPDSKYLYRGKIYSQRPGDNGIIRYFCQNSVSGEYEIIDTLVRNIWGECLDWDRNGMLWVGSYWNAGDYDLKGWYALDPSQNFEIVDSVGQNYGYIDGSVPIPPGGTFYAPRGAAWSFNSDTMYTADFDGHVIKKWSRSPTDIRIDNQCYSPKNILLNHNYPNPFNATTKINYSIPNTGWATIKIFDLLGREIITLVDQYHDAGSYDIEWDAKDIYRYEVSSGLYFCRISIISGLNILSDIKKILLLR